MLRDKIVVVMRGRYNAGVSLRGPKSGRLRLVIHYATRALAYNLVISVLGAAALFAVSLAAGDETQTMTEHAVRAMRIASVLGPILVVTGGYIVSVLAMRLFHHREFPFYFNRGLGQRHLSLGSWVVALIIAAILLAMRQLWV